MSRWYIHICTHNEKSDEKKTKKFFQIKRTLETQKPIPTTHDDNL